MVTLVAKDPKETIMKCSVPCHRTSGRRKKTNRGRKKKVGQGRNGKFTSSDSATCTSPKNNHPACICNTSCSKRQCRFSCDCYQALSVFSLDTHWEGRKRNVCAKIMAGGGSLRVSLLHFTYNCEKHSESCDLINENMGAADGISFPCTRGEDLIILACKCSCKTRKKQCDVPPEAVDHGPSPITQYLLQYLATHSQSRSNLVIPPLYRDEIKSYISNQNLCEKRES